MITMSQDVYHMTPEPNSTPETFGSRCDLCPKLKCIEQPKSRIRPWRYYCEALSANVDVWKVTKKECPLGRDARKRRRR